ncbi:MAG: hypothetical protein AAF544_03070 [Bacteroidota bacterium]
MRKAVLKPTGPSLSEQDIRRLAIGFLRVYYRDEARKNLKAADGEETDEIALWSQDQRWVEYSGHTYDKPHVFRNGITIDARLTYTREDGSEFIATVEATDLKRRRELDYQFNWLALLQDGIGVAALGVAIYLVLPQVGGTTFAFDLLTAAGWAKLFTGFLIGILIYFLLAHRRVSYRYIYAVNQFRRFYADHQWVAFDAELYPEPTDPSLLELQRQCTRYGLGMMVIEADRSVRLHMAPSRFDQFGGRRQVLPAWMSQVPENKMLGGLKQQSGRLLQQAKSVTSKMRALPAPGKTNDATEGQKITNSTDGQVEQEEANASQAALPTSGSPLDPSGQTIPNEERPQIERDSYGPRSLARDLWNRFRGHKALPWQSGEWPLFYRPRWWSLSALALGIFVFFSVRTLQWREANPVPIIDPQSVKDISSLEVDSLRARRIQPNSREIEEEITGRSAGLDIEPEINPEDNPLADLREDAVLLGGTDLYTYKLGIGGQPILAYDCDPLYAQPEQLGNYLLVVGSFERFSMAEEAARAWYANTGQSVTVARSSCLFSNWTTNFSIYLGEPMIEESEANLAVRRLRGYYTTDVSIAVVR